MFSRELVSDLARRRVVLFLGAGVSASAITNNGVRFKSWENFLRDAADLVQNEKKKKIALRMVDERRFLDACEVIKRNMSKETWDKLCSDEFIQIAQPSELHERLVKLDQRIVITTNFDRLYEFAWNNVFSKSKKYFPARYAELNEKVFAILKKDGDFIINVHGSVDDPDKMIFSISDYAKSAFGNERYIQFLSILMLNFTFLFVGFSMSDPAINAVVEHYAVSYPSARPHYLLWGGAMDDDEKYIYREFKKIVVIEYDRAENHKALIPMLDELIIQMNTAKRDFFADEAAIVEP